MRRAYTIGAPSVFVNKNRLGQFPEFRDQGVGGSNPLSPTISFRGLNFNFYTYFARPGGQPSNRLLFRALRRRGSNWSRFQRILSRVAPVMFSVVTSELPVIRPQSEA